jgi:long-chain acyl-CoA synthetase
MVKSFKTLPELLLKSAASYNNPNFMNYKKNGMWISLSTSEFLEKVKYLSLGLMKLGLQPGENVGITAPPSPYWVMIDLAIQIAGGVTTPIFKKISDESLTHEIEDSAMRFIFVGHENELEPVKRCGKDKLEKVIFYRGDGEHAPDFLSIFDQGKLLAKEEPSRFEQQIKQITEDTLATIIYTSGSTGLPKGVELLQKSIVSQVNSAHERFQLKPGPQGEIALSMLPLAHIFERMVMYYYISLGLSVYFVDDPKEASAYMREIKPTVMTVVPRVLEKAYIKIIDKIEGYTGFRKKLALAAVERAKTKDVTTPFRGFKDFLYRKMVYTKLLAALGGRFETMISGASKMPPAIGQFFLNIGLPIYEGYGLTEASPVLACNYPGHRKNGSVGPIFPGVEIKISEEGEVLAKGPNIMKGYHNRPDASSEVLKDGWLYTGDLGSIDSEGFLTITGRKKHLFKKSTGEYVPPDPIEQHIGLHPAVDTAMVIADARPYTTCLIFPDYENMEQFMKKNGHEAKTMEEFISSDDLREEIQKYINHMNNHLHHCEHVEYFRIIPNQISVDGGELTPTLKVRRHFIEEKYKSYIDDLYEGSGGWK